MEIGSWAIIQEPSLLALIPLIIFIVLAFREVNNTVAAIAGCTVGAVLLGLNLKAVAAGIQAALGSSTVMMGVIVMMGAALGALMNEARITHTIVYWFVKKIGVNTRTKAKIVLIICTITVCGLLGTMGGMALAALLVIAVAEIVIMIRSKTNATIHDYMSATVAVDISSQMIFDSPEALMTYRQQAHAEQVKKQTY